MKFLQVQLTYDTLLADIYGKDQSLKFESYDFQLQRILSTRFSFSHFLVEELKNLGLETKVVLPNAISLQNQWAKENNASSSTEVLVEQIEHFKPDILYIVGAIRTLDSTLLRKLKHKPRITIGWLGSNIPPETDWSEFDCILSGLPELRKTAIELGAKHSFEFYPGIPHSIFSKFSTINPNPIYDMVFVGSCNQVQHKKRASYLEFLAEQEINLGLYLSGDTSHLSPILQRKNKGPLFGIQMLNKIYESKISFDCRASHTFGLRDIGKEQTVNMRLFESTAVGSMLLTEDFADLDQLFVKGQEIITFKCQNDLSDKIRFYLSNDALRRDIAEHGRNACIKKHDLKTRSLQFLSYIEKLLSG